MQIVPSVQAATQHLAGLVQVVQVGAAVTGANIATALRVQGLFAVAMFGVAYFDIAPGGEKVSVAPVARRHNAVKQVYAPQDAFHQILRRAHAHEVAGLVDGQQPRRALQGRQHHVGRLADGQAPNGVAVKPHGDQGFDGALPQLLEHASLRDAEQGGRVSAMGFLATLRPQQG